MFSFTLSPLVKSGVLFGLLLSLINEFEGWRCNGKYRKLMLILIFVNIRNYDYDDVLKHKCAIWMTVL